MTVRVIRGKDGVYREFEQHTAVVATRRVTGAPATVTILENGVQAGLKGNEDLITVFIPVKHRNKQATNLRGGT